MKARRSELDEVGFVRFEVGRGTEPTLDIARNIGEIAAIRDVDPVQRLIPRVADLVRDSSYSDIYGMNGFPLHTDMAHWHLPPHYLLLRCVSPAIEVQTCILHSNVLFEGEDRSNVRRALFRPRRRLEKRLTFLRLRENERCRWDPVFIQPANRIAAELSERVRGRLDSAIPSLIALASARDCLVIDNWRVLHGRSAVPTCASNRILDRVYLSSVSL